MPPKHSRLAGTGRSKHSQAGIEPVLPSRNLGLPTREQHEVVMEDYIQSLSIRKREKALISQKMFDDIWDVLQDPLHAKIRSPQFRFWVRKMFKLSPSETCPSASDGDADVILVITHERRPVAVKEQLYDILSYYHTLGGHGGRDKTMAEVKQHYSWVPKELVARFVKVCPTCTFKKTGAVPSHPAANCSPVKAPLAEARAVHYSASDHFDTETISSSSSQAASLASEDVPPVDLTAAPAPLASTPLVNITLASLLESRILPAPVVSPMLRSPPLGSPSLSADPRKWLADLTSQPGPNSAGTSHKFPPLLLRRTGTENDALPLRKPSTRITLPPLMKALSEDMADPDVPRPAFNVPSDLEIPARMPSRNILDMDVDMEDVSSGLLYPNDYTDGEYSNIDPALLGEALPVVNTYDSTESKPERCLSAVLPGLTRSPAPQQSVVFPVDFDYRVPAMQRSVSKDSVSSAGSVDSIESVVSQDQVASAGVQECVLNASAKNIDGLQQSSSYDPQDWESTYCLDDV